MRDVRGNHLSRQISMEVAFLAKVNTLSCNWTTAVWTTSLFPLLILIIICCFLSTTRCLVVFRSSFLPRLSECWQIRIEIQILPFLPSPPSSSPSPSATSSSCSSPPSLPFRQPYVISYNVNISTNSIFATDMSIIWLQLHHINHLEYYIHRVQVILLGLCSLQCTQHCSPSSHLCAVEQHFTQHFKQARKPRSHATATANYDPTSYSLTGVKCRATDVAKKYKRQPK